MKFEDLIRQIDNLPILETEILFAGKSSAPSIKVQISRWQKAGKLIQLRRGIYLLAEPYRKVSIHEPYLASILVKPSYLSLEKALEYHGMIPESVPIYTSITTKRPGKFLTPVGTFDYRHIQPAFFWGYEPVTLNGQTSFIASPEKALLDLVYLKSVKFSEAYLEGMRLQNLKKISSNRLIEYAERFKKNKILHAAKIIQEYIHTYKSREKKL